MFTQITVTQEFQHVSHIHGLDLERAAEVLADKLLALQPEIIAEKFGGDRDAARESALHFASMELISSMMGNCSGYGPDDEGNDVLFVPTAAIESGDIEENHDLHAAFTECAADLPH